MFIGQRDKHIETIGSIYSDWRLASNTFTVTILTVQQNSVN